MFVMVDVKFVHLNLITIHGWYNLSLAHQFVSIHYCVSWSRDYPKYEIFCCSFEGNLLRTKLKPYFMCFLGVEHPT
jgi:hypothetical protein